MRITFLGHAGCLVETRRGSVLCDPWFTPAYFGSWFPFPRNDDLPPAVLERVRAADYLYISHLHRDHFDPQWLGPNVGKQARVLLPDFGLICSRARSTTSASTTSFPRRTASASTSTAWA